MDWLDLLAVQGTLKSLLQYHTSKASILRRSAFFTVQLSHPYMTTGKTIALTRWTLVSKVLSLLLNMLSRLVITFLPRSKRLLISWLQSPSAVILLTHIYSFSHQPWNQGPEEQWQALHSSWLNSEMLVCSGEKVCISAVSLSYCYIRFSFFFIKCKETQWFILQ